MIIQLAKDMGGTVAEAFPWDDYQGCLEETLEELASLLEEGFRLNDGFSSSNLADALKPNHQNSNFPTAR